jgi:hypothetical protein
MAKKRLSLLDDDNFSTLGDIPLPETETPLDKILGDDEKNPLYTDKSSIEDMEEQNNNFYKKTSSKAFNAMFQSEQDKLTDLVNATYQPSKPEEDITDYDLMIHHLNLIK